MPRTYRLSPSGRRYNLLMIAVAMQIWAFALWSFASTLRLNLHPVSFWSDLQRLGAQPVAIEQAVPALLLFVLIVATPLLLWNLITEWDATFSVSDEGLGYSTMGVQLCVLWEDITAIRPSPVAADETVIVYCRHDPSDEITNPLRRWLHRQAHGRQRLVISTGVEQRDELVAQIKQAIARHNTLAEVLVDGRAPSG